jgi:hypothetical protein
LLRVYIVQKERESCEHDGSESGDEGLVDDNGEAIRDEVGEGGEVLKWKGSKLVR